MKPSVSEIQVVALKDIDIMTGAVGYASCLINHTVRLNGIHIYGIGTEPYLICFPKIILPDDTVKPAYDLLDPDVSNQIENEILEHWDSQVLSMRSDTQNKTNGTR